MEAVAAICGAIVGVASLVIYLMRRHDNAKVNLRPAARSALEIAKDTSELNERAAAAIDSHKTGAVDSVLDCLLGDVGALNRLRQTKPPEK